MTDIGPGTPLICVYKGSAWGLAKRGPQLTVGAMYFCAVVVERDVGCECHMGFLLALKDWPPHIFVCPCLFRPLNDGDESLVKHEAQTKIVQLARKVKDLIHV